MLRRHVVGGWSGTMACARRSPATTEEGKGRFLCRLCQGLGSKARMTLDERFPLERWTATSWWHRSPEATGITPQGSARGGQAGAKCPSCNPMTCPNTDCGCEGSSRTRKKGQNQIKTSAAKNLREAEEEVNALLRSGQGGAQPRRLAKNMLAFGGWQEQSQGSEATLTCIYFPVFRTRVSHF